ncbi:hypothetical protein ACN47E_004187 [Coniothyrium glycines]
MADAAVKAYKPQVIRARYIKKIVLESFVNDLIAEFGEHWSCSFPTNMAITFVALRPLTNAELDELQARSNGTASASNEDYFVD